MTDAIPRSGPIGPEHERDGWEAYDDGKGHWYLIKDFGKLIGIISGTTLTECAWQITTRTGDLRREASAGDDVAAARAEADGWARRNPE